MAQLNYLAALAALSLSAAAHPQVLGADAAACTAGDGPAILANIAGLKDAKGSLKLEIYPANEADFLKADHDLIAQGKTFRRVSAPAPAGRAASMCIRVPRPGRYALLFTHDRDGKNKFNFWSDGAGFPSNAKLGRARPKVALATIDVGGGIATTNIRAQYLRGLGGFGPLKD